MQAEIRRWREQALFLGAAAVIALSNLLARVPSLQGLAQDSDWGHQLAGAQAILEGRHPFVDFNVTYGPLAFYLSALAQWLGSGRISAEVLLCVVGYATAYVLLASTAHRLTRNAWISVLALVLALATAPRLYKYYLVLGPAFTAFAALGYLERPTRGRFWLLAVAVTATGLFRSDFGFYATTAATLAVAIADDPKAGPRFARVAKFWGAVLAVSLPWLAWLAFHGALGNYLLCSSIESARHSQGLALPLPPIGGGNWGDRILFLLGYGIPPFCVALALADRGRGALEKRGIAVIAAMALIQMIQASHRSDVGHLLQSVTFHLVLVGWLAMQAWEQAAAGGRLRAAIAFAPLPAIVVAVANSSVSMPSWTAPNAVEGIRRIAAMSVTPPAATPEQFGKGRGDPYFDALNHLRESLGPADRIFVVPYSLGMYYFSGHAFAGNQMGLSPGYFTTPDREAAFVRSLERDPPRLVVDAPSFSFDGNAERNPRHFSPRVIAFLDKHYRERARYGPFVVLEPVALLPGRTDAGQPGSARRKNAD